MNLIKLEARNPISGNSEELTINTDQISAISTIPTYQDGKKVIACSIMLASGQVVMTTEKELTRIIDSVRGNKDAKPRNKTN